MAWLTKIKNKDGTRRYQIGYRDGDQRKFISLPSYYDETDADEARVYVDKIIRAQRSESDIDRKTRTWLENIGEELRSKLVAADLIEVETETSCKELFDKYFEALEYENVKPTTRSNKRQARRRFERFFDSKRSANDLTLKDVASFVAFLDKQYKEATRAGAIRDLRRVWNWGVKNGLVENNPFSEVKRGSFTNKSREYYVPIKDYELLLDSCPTQQLRALLALYRIGGLRKGEALLVAWSDVDFVRGRLLVHSPKTANYTGKSSRVVPLFPKLRAELETLLEIRECEISENSKNEFSPFVISKNRTTVFKKVEQIVFLSGLNRWERLIQNLRSSCAIDVYNEYGELAESEWIGHNPTTAKNHYLHVLDETFERATSVAKQTTDKTTDSIENQTTFLSVKTNASKNCSTR